MRKTYLSLLILAMTMVSMVAKAQYKAEITTDPVEDYVAGYVNFDPIEIATALGTDTATLHKAISASGNYYIQTADGRSNEYTGNKDLNEFWMDNNGNPVGWGNGNTWFSGLEYVPAGTDAETGATWSDSVYISFGQMPGVFKNIYTPSVLKATTYLVVGEKEISFEIIQNINAAPEPTLPDPVTKLSGLTIVGEWTLELPFYIGKSFEGLTFTTTLDGVYDALGTTAEELDASAADYVYAHTVNVDTIKDADGNPTDEVVYSLSDDLAQPISTTDGWFGRYINFDETTAAETPLPINALMSWGNDKLTFYVQAMTLTNGEYSVRAGQYGNAFTSVEQSDSTYHYIIVGDKAAKIKIVVKMQEQETLPLTEMTQIGEETIEIEHYIGGSDGQITLDLANLETLLGAGAINFEVLADESGTSLSSNTTANNGGYWMTTGGFPISWGTDGFAIFVEPATTGDFSTLNYGFNDAAWTLGDKSTIKLYFHNGTQYYVVNLNVTIIEQPQIGEDEFDNIETIGLVYQFIPNAEGYPLGTTQLDMEYISSLIGEGTYKLYTLTAPTEDSPSIMTDSYNCDPKPGFWMKNSGESESYIGAWGSGASYGMGFTGGSIINGTIEWFNMPGERAVGDEFYSTFFIVNMDNGKMVTLRINIKFVDVIIETEIVGTEDVIAAIDNPEDLTYTKVDLTAAATALGIDNPDLFGSAEVKILKTATSYTSDFYDLTMGWFLDENGWCYDLNNNAEAAMTAPVNLGYDWDFASYDFNFFTTAMGDAPADGVIYRTKVALEYDAKMYIFNVKIMNRETATGIENIDAANKVNAGNVYDLSGRLVRKNATSVKGLANGVYLLNGKKYIVK